MMNLDEAILREDYAHIADRPFFPEIVAYMTSGPVFGMVVEGGKCGERHENPHGRNQI